MRRTISFLCASAMLVLGAYFAVSLSRHVLHWPVIGSAGLAVLGMLWLWEDFISPRRRADRRAPSL